MQRLHTDDPAPDWSPTWSLPWLLHPARCVMLPRHRALAALQRAHGLASHSRQPLGPSASPGAAQAASPLAGKGFMCGLYMGFLFS